MRALIAALRSPAYWRHGISYKQAFNTLLSSFGGLWLITEIIDFFSDTLASGIRNRWWAFLVIGILVTFWRTLPKTCFSCRLKGRDVEIEVRIADMFSLEGAFVVGSNTSFDTDASLISERSVQGQFTKRFYDSVAHLDGDLTSALEDLDPIKVTTLKKGKHSVYEVGTTVHVIAKRRRAYFVGLATMSNDGIARATFDDLQNTLPVLWNYILTKGGDIGPLVMPVIGSGFSRLTELRETIIREIVDSFVAACSNSRPTEKLTIVIPYKDFYSCEVDFLELEHYVQHKCKYSDYREPSAIGAGAAIA